ANNASFTGTNVSLGTVATEVLTAGGNASFTSPAGGTISVLPGGTMNFGSLTFNTAGAVNITEDSATPLAGSSTAGRLALASAGAITNAAAASLNVTNNASFFGT